MFIALIPFLMTKGSFQGTVPQAMLFPALSPSASLIVIWICFPSGSADSCSGSEPAPVVPKIVRHENLAEGCDFL